MLNKATIFECFESPSYLIANQSSVLSVTNSEFSAKFELKNILDVRDFFGYIQYIFCTDDRSILTGCFQMSNQSDCENPFVESLNLGTAYFIQNSPINPAEILKKLNTKNLVFFLIQKKLPLNAKLIYSSPFNGKLILS